MKQARQGDILILRTRDKPAGEPFPRENGDIVLAHGEATGHRHRLSDKSVDLYARKRDGSWLLVITALGGAELLHEEHRTIHLPAGHYEIRRQREWRLEQQMRVED